MSKADIKALLRLARIDISDDEEKTLAADSERILEFVEQIQKVHGEVPVGEASAHSPINVFRDDVNPHESGIYTDAILANAPEREGNYIRVKKILG